jgi:uncharacterized membrane protein YfcA
MPDYDLFHLSLILGAGFLAGFINTIAGGGTMLTFPALVLLGLPVDVANATNRVGVFLQGSVGAYGYYRKGRMDSKAIIPSLLPVLIGSLVGSLLASYLPNTVLKPTLLICMALMAITMLLNPASLIRSVDAEVLSPRSSGKAMIAFFLAGLYGGFAQAGVGFILLAAYGGVLGYDLVRANALKVVITVSLTVIALIIFISRGQIYWLPGLILAFGGMAGAWLSVNFATRVDQSILKWIVFVMVVVTCLVAWLQE